MASKSKKSKVPDKKASAVSSASKKSKDSKKSKTSLKVAPKSKPAPAKATKAPPKPAAKKVAPKPVAKKASPIVKAKVVVKAIKPSKPASKTPAKPAPKSSAKSAPKLFAKSAPKVGSTKILPKKAASVKSSQMVAAKPSAKTSKSAIKSVPAKAKMVATKAIPAKPTPKAPVRPKPVVKTAPAKAAAKIAVKTSSVKATAPKAPAAAKAVVKVEAKAPVVKPTPEPKAKAGKIEFFKGPFFHEVAVGSPAMRKNKAPQVVVSNLRKPKGEESHDELIARIERELLTVRMTTRKVQREQVCTKCCINPVEPGYMVDRDTGYCMECALVLGLGHTREARQQNFHPSLMKSEDEEAPVVPELPE